MKKVFLLILLSILSISCKTGSGSVNKESKHETKYVVNNLIETATANIGIRYKAAGTTKAGFDCSGLVFSTFKTENIELPRSSYEQSKIGRVIKFDDARKGDLIFFKTNKSKQINHVGLITEVSRDEIKFVHSSTSKGVIISSTKENYYKTSFVQINRIVE
ncbi:C40 family peptidase [Flavobacterium fluviatile]|uniref:C40 family peptidase n=1 Tax=Flavobacterium fluviatile TaxID=1862387 RepID=UPI0013D6FC50|nr:C40 family peptidase [Flavobacterium fluviatile]